MKNLRLVYNPFAGDKNFKNTLDDCVDVFQSGGYCVDLLRCVDAAVLDKHFQRDTHYDAIVVAGGDGTVNTVLNAMMQSNQLAPLGIIPAGTANDFSTFLNMPRDPVKASLAIVEGGLVRADIGRVGERYFINVCGAGLFTTISQHVDERLKDSLGKLAYYIKGIEQLPNFVPLPLRITTENESLEEELYFFIALNSAGSGGFERLSPEASITDGVFDFIGVRAIPLMELAKLFVRVLRAEHLDHPGLLFLRAGQIRVESLQSGRTPLYYETDMDGEMGPDLPIYIENIPRAIDLIIPPQHGSAQTISIL